jgi:hypothetical protein
MVVCGQAFVEMRGSGLYNQVVAFSLARSLPIACDTFVQDIAFITMAGATGDGDKEWIRVNETHWRGLSLTDPIKDIEASPNNLPLHH